MDWGRWQVMPPKYPSLFSSYSEFLFMWVHVLFLPLVHNCKYLREWLNCCVPISLIMKQCHIVLHREVKSHTQGHTASQGKNYNSNPHFWQHKPLWQGIWLLTAGWQMKALSSCGPTERWGEPLFPSLLILPRIGLCCWRYLLGMYPIPRKMSPHINHYYFSGRKAEPPLSYLRSPSDKCPPLPPCCA